VNVTRACLAYMGRIMEMRDFVGFYFGFVKTSQELRKLVKDETLSPDEAPARGFVSLQYDFSQHQQLVNELILSRSVESFDLYVLNILRLIFEVKPEMLKSDKAVPASTLIELRTPEEIIYYLAQRQLDDLGYKPLTELRRWVKRRTGIDLFVNEDTFEIALLATEVRNIIAHNDCTANDTIRARIGDRMGKLDISEQGKVRISHEWLTRACYTLDGAVFDFDEAACAKFDIFRANRFGTFYLRE
jgi:hypothetical protein